jgi:hypothetical protein
MFRKKTAEEVKAAIREAIRRDNTSGVIRNIILDGYYGYTRDTKVYLRN